MVVHDQSDAWHDDAVRRLQELVTLQKGWDGYGAPAVRFENAHFALGMLKAICPPDMPIPPQFVPGTRGDLQVQRRGGLEWPRQPSLCTMANAKLA